MDHRREPGLRELLEACIVRQLMRKDRVDPRELEAMMARVRERRGVDGPVDGFV